MDFKYLGENVHFLLDFLSLSFVIVLLFRHSIWSTKVFSYLHMLQYTYVLVEDDYYRSSCFRDVSRYRFSILKHQTNHHLSFQPQNCLLEIQIPSTPQSHPSN